MEPTTQPEGSILIAHIADTHLRDTQYATARRGQDFFDAFKAAVTEACSVADVLVLVGDIFDRARPGPRVIQQLMQIDALIQSRKKICFAVTGNHDWGVPTWIDTLFGGRTARLTDPGHSVTGIIPIDGESNVQFRGFSFAGVTQRSAGAFRSDMAEIEAQTRGADVVLFHGFVDGIVPMYAGSHDPLRVGELPIAKSNKAWLLGDIHVQGFVRRDRPGGGSTLIGYPGSLEMCSASEPLEKSVPLVRVTKEHAEVESCIRVPTRPFIRAKILTESDLDDLIAKITPLATAHPVVVAEFSRALPQTINRLHSVLDAQRAVIRCYPLPDTKVKVDRDKEGDGEEELTMEHFVTKRFSEAGDEELQVVALALLHRGDDDAANIVSNFIEETDAAVSAKVRED